MKKEEKKKILIIFAVMVIFLMILLIILGSINNKKEEITPEMQIEITNKKIQEIEVNKLSEMDETERMKYYCKEFFNNIENKKYDKAYEVLNEDFKNNYFKTVNEFEKYAKEKLPHTIAIEYTNCERLGDLYIVWTNIVDPIRSSKNEKKEVKVVIKEKDLDDIELSFSII